MALGLLTPIFFLSLFVGVLLVQTRGERLKVPWATIVIVAVTLSVGSFVAFDDRLLDALGSDPVRLAAGEWWRLITPLVGNEGGVPGLLIGLALLAIVATTLENLFGPWVVLGVYVGTCVVAQLVALLLPDAYPGASVAAFGLVGLLLTWSMWGAAILRIIAGIGLILGLVLLATLDLHGVGLVVGALVAVALQLVRLRKERPRISARSAAPGSSGVSSAGS